MATNLPVPRLQLFVQISGFLITITNATGHILLLTTVCFGDVVVYFNPFRFIYHLCQYQFIQISLEVYFCEVHLRLTIWTRFSIRLRLLINLFVLFVFNYKKKISFGWVVPAILCQYRLIHNTSWTVLYCWAHNQVNFNLSSPF